MAPECATTTIPPHEHHVRLELTHSELRAMFGVRPGIGLSLRLPYDVKDQRVRYTTLDGAPFVPPYGDIHHRTETLRGLSDGDLLLEWEPLTTGASRWHLGAGFTLPLGATVPDPILLGREGLKHEHLQFGSGVVSPEFSLAWSRPLGPADVSAAIQAVLPVKENSEGFRASKSMQWSFGPSLLHASTRYSLALAGQYQTIGRWHGEVDEGTGFSNGGLRLEVMLPARAGFSVSPSLYRELYSHGLSDETFSQGTTLGLTITRRF